MLGLASYASDDDDNGTESSGKQSFKENNIQQQSTSSKLSKGMDVVDNGCSQKEHSNLGSDTGSSSQNATIAYHSAEVSELKDAKAAKPSNADPGMAEREVPDGDDASKLKKTLASKVSGESEKIVENDKNDKNDRLEHSAGKNHSVKGLEKENAYEKEGRHSSPDQRQMKKERRDNQDDSKERLKERVVKPAEKAKHTDPRKKASPDYDKERKKERYADRQTKGKEENDRKRERTKGDKSEKHFHRNSSESSRHKRHHSPSIASRGRDNREDLVVGCASDSSDESYDNSKMFVSQFNIFQCLLFVFDLPSQVKKKNCLDLLFACRKMHSKGRKSPSPVRSRKRYKRTFPVKCRSSFEKLLGSLLLFSLFYHISFALDVSSSMPSELVYFSHVIQDKPFKDAKCEAVYDLSNPNMKFCTFKSVFNVIHF